MPTTPKKPPPAPVFVNTLTPAQSKRVVRFFEATGHSTHSARMLSVPAILQHCLASGTPFRLEVHPTMGAFITKMPRSLL